LFPGSNLERAASHIQLSSSPRGLFVKTTEIQPKIVKFFIILNDVNHCFMNSGQFTGLKKAS